VSFGHERFTHRHGMMAGMNPAAIGLGLGLAAVIAAMSRKADPSTVPAIAPPPWTGPPPVTPPASAPPSDDQFVGLGDEPGLDRDSLIGQAVDDGKIVFPEWIEVDASIGSLSASVFVAATPLMVRIRAAIPEQFPGFDLPGGPNYRSLLAPYAGDLYEGLCAVNVTHPVAEAIAAKLGAHLPTSRISDLVWKQSRQVSPQLQKPDARMARTYRMVAHSLAIGQEVKQAPPGEPLIVRPLGKTWATSNLMTISNAVNFGWQFKGSRYLSPGGVPVLQPLSDFHTFRHADYSQVIYLVRNDMTVVGKQVPLFEVMRDPDWAKLVSDEGPLKLTRHPLYEEAIA